MLKLVTLGLRLRYILPATAVGGYYSAKSKYEEIKEALPEMPDFIKNLLDSGKGSLDSIDFESWSSSLNESARTLNEWFEEASTALQRRSQMSNEAQLQYLGSPPEKPRDWSLDKKQDLAERGSKTVIPIADGDIATQPDDNPDRGRLSKAISNTFKSVSAAAGGSSANTEKIEKLESEIKRKSDESAKRNEEIVAIRKELDRIRKENRELRSIVQGGTGGSGSMSHNMIKRRLKKSLIEIYSEVLDELSGYDSSYKVQDHLPKVVVVGDQSSGKTSVLEMIAGARIFPRGAGEMMTRAPVQVTLSEGPYHIARFKDNSREYDLTKESELADLRKEIEDRMRRSVQGGKTVSSQVISLTIQGPGIQRMVLVDLPGIIGTVTTELAPDTKECIKKMVSEYMGNPNAIILCIQDGSIDAERSIFTDLVREVDKKGRRTILVLTKVDIAEKTHTNPAKIKKILDGELFPMKALGYYAVVAGKSGKTEDIQEIKDYEENFFLTSSLCEKGILNPNQCSTRKLSSKVSECFWGMVKASIEQQADAYKATLFNLEAEWNHHFPHMRQLTRDELFYNARNEILDEVAKLSRLSTKHWDQFISTQLWDRVKTHIIQGVYIPASSDPMHFSAKVDIELQRWVESLELPKLAIKVAQDSVRYQFDNLLDPQGSGSAVDQYQTDNRNRKRNNSADSNNNEGNADKQVYQELKRAVIHDALERHQWKNQAMDVLRVVQLEALSKQMSLTRENWDRAISFLQDSLKHLIESTSQELTELTGYSFSQRWLKWKSTTPDQRTNQLIQQELDKLLSSQEFIKGTANSTTSNASSSSSSTSATALASAGSSMYPSMLMMVPHVKLGEAEIIAVKRNLESQGIEASEDMIQRLWQPYYRHMFLKSEVNRAQECSKVFYFYENDLDSGTDCSHVLFFWRIKRMLEFTANSLRRQILEDECRRIEKEIIEVLDEYSEDELKKLQLLSGKRVELAEELRRVRQIQEKLDEFIAALNQEGAQ